MHNLIGQQLGPYEITAEIGHGGMGNVYRAKQPSMGREVASGSMVAVTTVWRPARSDQYAGRLAGEDESKGASGSSPLHGSCGHPIAISAQPRAR
jgi:hypothetical protein